jgi:integration host factor subunit alpha
VVENLVEIIKCTLGQGEKVLISGFGKFEVIDRNPRRGGTFHPDASFVFG